MRTLTPQNEDDLLNALDPTDDDIAESYTGPAHIPGPARTWKSKRNATATLLMLDAGLRVGEVVRLSTHDVYFQSKPVQTLLLAAGITKGRHARNVPLTARLRQSLEKLYPFFQRPPLEYNLYPLIAKAPGGPTITTRTLERTITKAGEISLGFPVHPHMLRHTFATKLMKLTDIRTVQELLGHKHLTSTQIYTHVNDEDKWAAIQRLGL